MCACTEPDGSGIGAVYVECDGQTWPINMLTHTNKYTQTDTFFQGNLPSSAIRYQGALVRYETKKRRLALRARAPHYKILATAVVTTTCAGNISLYCISVS